MKKTQRVGLLCATLLAATSCCTLLAACGSGNESEPHKHDYGTTWITSDTQHWHECKNSGCDEKENDKAAHEWNDGVITTEATADADGIKTFTCKMCDKTKTEPVEYIVTLTENTDFAALVSDKVTEAEWKAAFAEASFSNCTIKYDFINIDGDDNTYKSDIILKIDKSDTRDYRNRIDHIEVDGQMVEVHPSEMSYWSLENNIITFYEYGYEDDLDTLYKGTTNYEADDKFTQWMFSYKIACADFGEYYNDFTYDDTLHAYVCKNKRLTTNHNWQPWDCEHEDIVIKIVNGRLAYASSRKIIVDDDGKDYHTYEPTQLYVYNYSTTQVTMPTNAIDYPEQEEQPPYEE